MGPDLNSLQLMLLKLAQQEAGATRRPANPTAAAPALRALPISVAEREMERPRSRGQPAARALQIRGGGA